MPAGSEAARLLEEDARYFFHQTLSTPCLNAVKASSGSTLTDLADRKIYDFHGNSVHQVGYGHMAIMDAIKRQLDVMPFCPRRYTNKPAVELAKRLAALAPGDLNRVLFTPSGAASIGLALKMARVVTGRHKTVSMWDSFHGASLDAISVGGEAVFRANVGPLLPGTSHAPPSGQTPCVFGCGGSCNLRCADYVEYILERETDVACVVAEPIRWTPYVPPQGYWEQVRRACDKHGALLIFDEIPLSLGRTGHMFTCEYFGVEPDILVVGKGLGGGVLPLSAVIGRDRFNAKVSTMALGHYTHEKNPTLCAAGLATLDVIEEEGILGRVRDLSAHAMERLRSLQEKYPQAVADVRGAGLLIGVELKGDPDLADRVLYASLSRGLSFKVTMGNICTLCPPLVISREELDDSLRIFEEALDASL